jgi:mono/diheme cytochrome c family protein
VTARALILMVAACSGAGHHPSGNAVADPGEAMFNGATNPKINCHECHGRDGRGTKDGPALGIRLPKLTDATLRTLILDGGQDMPGYRDVLHDDELESIVRWLRKKFGGPPR